MAGILFVLVWFLGLEEFVTLKLWRDLRRGGKSQANTNNQPTRRKRSVEASGVVEIGWLNLWWCSLRQSRERATYLLFVSRPMTGKDSRSKTRHERSGGGTLFEEERADGITLYKYKTTRDRICWTLCRALLLLYVWIVGICPVLVAFWVRYVPYMIQYIRYIDTFT